MNYLAQLYIFNYFFSRAMKSSSHKPSFRHQCHCAVSNQPKNLFSADHCYDILIWLQQSIIFQHSLHFRCSGQWRSLGSVSQDYSDLARPLITLISSCSHTIHWNLLDFSHTKVYATSTLETHQWLKYRQKLSTGSSGTNVFALFMDTLGCFSNRFFMYISNVMGLSQTQSHSSPPWPVHMARLETHRPARRSTLTCSSETYS